MAAVGEDEGVIRQCYQQLHEVGEVAVAGGVVCPQQPPLVVAVAVEAVAHEEHRVTLQHVSDLVAVEVVGLACGVEMMVIMCVWWMMWKMGGKEVGVVAGE